MTLLTTTGCQLLVDATLRDSRANTQSDALAFQAQDPASNQNNGAPPPLPDPPLLPRTERLPPPTISGLQTLGEEISPPPADGDLGPLQLSEVISSVEASFPVVRAAMMEAAVAEGKQLSARGAFDLKLEAISLNMPEGFYQNYRQGVKAEQPTFNGGTVYGMYRIGDGSFQPWYGERETNEGGEFKVGAALPLLRGRAIDERRAEILKADLQRAMVDPVVQQEVLFAVQAASNVYWSWIAAGKARNVTRDLLNVAIERNNAIKRQVELGNLPITEQQQNERLIASREAKLIEAERKLQAAAIKLSLFLRDVEGRPVVPTSALLPDEIPEATSLNLDDFQQQVDLALRQRPELRGLSLMRQTVEVDLRQGENELLPNLSAVLEASKDVGGATSSKGDKTPFELEAGLLFDVPLQRSKARGKIQSAEGKLTQLSLKQQFQANKIIAEVQDAMSARLAAYERLQQARTSVELAKKLVAAEYRSFELGNSDVLRIALQEAAELDAQILEIEALRDYFQAEADFRAAIGALNE
jgi:outer membrane protein TolC